MALKFGTDGVRGVANVELTPEVVLALGRAAARALGSRMFVVGRDTRISGPMLQAALTAGLASEGADVLGLGVVPTPAVAWAAVVGNGAGAVVSASHNPFHDNGVKFFTSDGLKLSDGAEAEIEETMRSLLIGKAGRDATTGAVGYSSEVDAMIGGYEQHVLESLEGRSLDGLHVVLDCGHGATTTTAPSVFAAAGAKVDLIGDRPDGTNINDGFGSTHPDRMREAVVESAADMGLAFDGDGDRVVAADGTGDLVDGDHILALCAADLHAQGRLRGRGLVVTVMSNLGLRLAMAERGIEVVETDVGDRNVVEALDQHGYSLGGEQSGHVIFRDLATTGDGVMTGLQLADLVVRAGRPLAALAAEAMTSLPQVLRNVRVRDRAGLDDATEVWDQVRSVEADLAGKGRVLVRASGTEPVVRVMVEAPTDAAAEKAADDVAGVVARILGAPGSP